MIGYVTLGTNDLERAARFYDALLGELGARRYIETSRGISWSVSPDRTSLGATDEGEPGPRGSAGFYAGSFRDLDGNKLDVFCIERGP